VNLPTIALVCSLTWITWLVPVWIAYAWGQRVSQGLWVSLPRKNIPAVTVATGLAVPLVKIDAQRNVYLNYKQTAWMEMPGGLEQALRGLSVRVVYFDAHNDALFMDAAWAIDIIPIALLFATAFRPSGAGLPQSRDQDSGIVRPRYATTIVRDYDEALRWYTGVLGLEKVEEGSFGSGQRWLVGSSSPLAVRRSSALC
jgi:hypothetical protein